LQQQQALVTMFIMLVIIGNSSGLVKPKIFTLLIGMVNLRSSMDGRRVQIDTELISQYRVALLRLAQDTSHYTT
jgi:hypothetical protein